MEREISSGAMLGIVLLALAAVIGLGFGVFAITKGVANEGTVNVQDSLGTVSNQVFLDYDQKIVTGQQVQSAIKSFEGKPYAVLISTRGMQADGKIIPGHKAYTFQVDVAGEKFDFVNYNAVLAKSAGSVAVNQTSGSTEGDKIRGAGDATVLELDNGTIYTKEGFLAKKGNIVFDKETAGIYKTGNAEYLATSTKFQTYLIKDKSENIMGIVAIQK